MVWGALMSIEVSDDTVWKAVFAVFAAGISFAAGVVWRLAGMSTKIKSHDERLDAIDAAAIKAAEKASATHDIVVALNASMSHVQSDVHEIKNAFITLVKTRVK